MLSALQPLPAVTPVPSKMPAGLNLPKSTVPSDYSGKLQTQLWKSIEPVIYDPSRSPLSPARADSAGAIQVQIQTTGTMTTALTALRRAGARIQTYSANLGIVQAWVRPVSVRQITKLAMVKSIGLPAYRQASSGSVQTEGDAILSADKVRQRFANLGIDGTGIKIGVISDGVDNIGSVTSELPAITINPSLPGSGDEGTAMLEIIHDMAPGAQLYFSGPLTNLDMVDSVNYLVAQGCDIIVDDLLFPGEPYFADGPVAQAAQAAIDAGVTYISAAGNQGVASGFYGDSHYQGLFNNDGVGFHDFDPGQNIDDFKEMLVVNGTTLTIFLQWSEAYGQSGTDYDLYLLSAGFQVIAASTNFQSGNSDPIEVIQWTNTTGADQFVRVLVNWFAGDPQREIEMFTFGPGTGAFDHNVSGDALVGQQAVEGVISVSAINANDAGHDNIEPFASQGPSTIYTDFNAKTSILRQTLDGAAVDGVQTRIGQLGFFSNPFFGTSAAAPHTAAIVALMLQANPSLSPAQVSNTLHATADDLTDYGVGFDQVSGFGRFNALNAVFASVVLGAPDLDVNSDTGLHDDDNITSDNTPTFFGTVPAGSFVRLYIDGVANQGVQLAPGVTTYALTATTVTDGLHQFTVRVADNSSIPVTEFSPPSQSLAVQIDTIGLALPAVQFVYDTFQALVFTFSEDISATFTPGDLLVENLTAGGTVPMSLLSPTSNIAQFGFLGGPLNSANYRATVLANAITDVAGNPMTGNLVFNFFHLIGDANHDRKVDVNDLIILSDNWLQTGKTFSQGNFNYDGIVDQSDLGLMAINWQATLAEPPPPLPATTTAARTSPARTPTRAAARMVGLVS